MLSNESSSRSILVVAAHPDDEVLGCGGTISRHTFSGDNVKILIVAEGATSRQFKRDLLDASDELNTLRQSAKHSASLLGVSDIEMLGLPDNRLDSIDRLDLIKKIEESIFHYRPDTVYVHHSGDVNVDHRRLHEAVVTACRPTPDNCVRRLLSFEVMSSTEWQPPGSGSVFQPNWFVDITAHLEQKCSALGVYASEMRPWPHSRSIQAIQHLAHWRGAQVGVHAAEAFCLLRSVV